jgi:hypothetical protein
MHIGDAAAGSSSAAANSKADTTEEYERGEAVLKRLGWKEKGQEGLHEELAKELEVMFRNVPHI